jgi:hypothetical protein
VVVLSDAPAMNRRETGLRIADEKQGRHWSRGRCWCGVGHDGAEAALTTTAPPWDVSRADETARTP